MMEKGGTILTLTYQGSNRVTPFYNVMGVAKAALEATTRYLANDLGPSGIRVNAISPGPMRTLAGAAIGGARRTFKHTEVNSPLRSNATLDAVGGTAVYLASDAGAYTTGEVLCVDGGYHVLGMPQADNVQYWWTKLVQHLSRHEKIATIIEHGIAKKKMLKVKDHKMQNRKKLFVKTYGCQMNVYDTERMSESLQTEGYVPTDSAEDADMILLNTCHIREKAAEKVYSELGRFKNLKSENPNLKIGVVGCVAR